MKLLIQIINSVLWINIITNNLEIIVFSRHTVKAKKHTHMGVFFCLYCALRKFLFFKEIGDKSYTKDLIN